MSVEGTAVVLSSLDNDPQRVSYWLPDERAPRRPVPLLVHLHSWSSDYRTSSDMDQAIGECRQRGWAFVSPDFRGPNVRPEACASELAVQDVLDAVRWTAGRVWVDPRRIYLTGGSGGGHMTLVMAGRAPNVWAAASAWVPITDLGKWHEFSKKQNSRYWRMIEQCCGGPPSASTAEEYRRRSPLTHLANAKGLPVAIDVGIRDGHEGSVPVSHSLRAFNVLAEANGEPGRRLTDAQIDAITRTATIPEPLGAEREEEAGRKRRVLFRRTAGPARLTIFDGGHEPDFPSAARWLEVYARPER